jgi:hypothetical protein
MRPTFMVYYLKALINQQRGLIRLRILNEPKRFLTLIEPYRADMVVGVTLGNTGQHQVKRANAIRGPRSRYRALCNDPEHLRFE